MNITPDVCISSESFLNKHILKVEGQGAAFHIHYWGSDPAHFDNPLHKHSFFEVCYCLDGHGSYTDELQQYSLTNGTLFCSRPGIWHQIKSKTGLLLLHVAFEVIPSASSEQVIKSFEELKDSPRIVIDTADDSPSALIWRALLLQSSVIQPLHEETASSLAHTLLLSIPQLFRDRQELKRLPQAHRTSSALLNQAKLFIRDNLSQPLRLEDVAGYLNISGRHLSRVFSGELGQTFTSFIRQQRIEKAAALLNTTTLPIKTIAQETGFTSVHYLTRVFSAEKGTSPGAFRKAHNSLI